MNKKIGFIGLGVMGKSMAQNLLKNNFSLFVYTRTKKTSDELVAKGAIWCDSVSGIAKNADIIITIVGFPSDVEDVYLGQDGLVANGHKGQILIDMTTSTPSLAVKICEKANEHGIFCLDAPVSGGDIGARDAKLTIMVGGNENVFKEVLPIFSAMGKNIVYHGECGSGQHTKMANQIAIAGSMIGMCEAFIYAKKAGLDLEKVLSSVSAGSASSWSMVNYTPRILKGDFSPGFYIKHFVKDMTIALNEAEKMGIITPGLKTVKEMYTSLMEQGEENSGTQALFKYWQ